MFISPNLTGAPIDTAQSDQSVRDLPSRPACQWIVDTDGALVMLWSCDAAAQAVLEFLAV